MKQIQTNLQKSREHLDEELFEEIAFVFFHIQDCKELEEIWDDSWPFCLCCGAPVKENNQVRHRKQ